MIEELVKWIDNYDSIKYPTGIYDELVVEGKEHSRKFSLMGAWKTGSLRVDYDGNEYTDKNSNSYTYTKRWSSNTPVGFEVWNYITDNQVTLKENIPLEFPKEKPSVVVQLEAKRGFGFIWTLFVLHCFYPEIYPLYDQHGYRAYRSIVTGGKEYPNLAPNNWNSYLEYRNFFSELFAKLNVDYWMLDRGLWAYGKHLKQEMIINNKGNCIEVSRIAKADNEFIDFKELNDWVHSTTLGGKAKSFWWKIDDNYDLYILRKFKGFETAKSKTINSEELEKIDKYVRHAEWVDLANNVEKLNNGTEKDGLGKFLCESLKWNTGEAQLASHLGVIFSLSGVWETNGKKRGIQFKHCKKEWKEALIELYLSDS